MKLRLDRIDEVGKIVEFGVDYLKRNGITLSDKRIGELGAYCLFIAQEYDHSKTGGTDGFQFATDMAPEAAVQFLAHIFHLEDARGE